MANTRDCDAMKTSKTSNEDDDEKHNDENNNSTNQVLGYIIALLRDTCMDCGNWKYVQQR